MYVCMYVFMYVCINVYIYMCVLNSVNYCRVILDSCAHSKLQSNVFAFQNIPLDGYLWILISSHNSIMHTSRWSRTSGWVCGIIRVFFGKSPAKNERIKKAGRCNGNGNPDLSTFDKRIVLILSIFVARRGMPTLRNICHPPTAFIIPRACLDF